MKVRYNYEIIRDYLDGLLESEAARRIGELIRTDEVARDIAEGIVRLKNDPGEKEGDIDHYLEKFRQIQLKKIERHTGVKKSGRLWLKIAASLLLLAVAGAAIFRLMNPPDLISRVEAALDKPYPMTGVLRGAHENDAYASAIQLYTEGRYAEAEAGFQEISENQNNQASVIFYRGLSALYAGHYSNAILQFESPVISKSRYEQQARWYKALSCIKAGRRIKARQILTSITNDPRHYKYEEALHLLDNL